MSSHDYHIAAEADLPPRASRQIWLIFIVLGIALFVTIGALTILYKFQVDYQKELKIGKVLTKEAHDQKLSSQAYLSGQQGIFSDKKHVAVEDAMGKFLETIRQ